MSRNILITIMTIALLIGLSTEAKALETDDKEKAGFIYPKWIYTEVTFRTEFGQPAGIWYKNFSVLGELEVIDVNGLIGITQRLHDASAVDDLGQEWQDVIGGERVYQRKRKDPYSTIDLVPIDFQIVFAYSPRLLGTQLDELTWTTYALFADVVEVDVPLAISNEWFHLTTTTKVKILHCETGNGGYMYVFQCEIGEKEEFSFGDIYSEKGLLPDAVVIGVQVLDSNLEPVSTKPRDYKRCRYTHMDRTIIFNEQGRCEACYQAHVLRFMIAKNFREQAYPMILQKIPLPSCQD